MTEFGIYCTDREEMRNRCLVSSGLTLLEPDDALRQGYYAPKVARVIIPATEPRTATDAELDSIIAGPDTGRVMQLCRLPRHIGEQILQACNENDYTQFDRHAVRTRIAQSITGLYMNCRTDSAGQLSVSVNTAEINPQTGGPSKVGLHIDTWEDPDLSLAIGNMGPGERWHCLVPGFNRDATGGPSRSDRMRFMENHPDPGSISVFWFKLKPPGPDYFETLLNSPVAWTMHDGSTLNCPDPSTVTFCDIDPVRLDAYPSPLIT